MDDEKRVLPVELQIVGYTYESVLGLRFSASELRQRGGKAGLYRAYIEDAKNHVLHKTGVSGEKALLALRQLISPSGTRWSRSAKEIAERKSGNSTQQVAGVLEAFADCFLVRRIPQEERERTEEEREGTEEERKGTDPLESSRFELMHEHLVQILSVAPEVELQRLVDAQARLVFWRECTRATSLGQPSKRANTSLVLDFGLWHPGSRLYTPNQSPSAR